MSFFDMISTSQGRISWSNSLKNSVAEPMSLDQVGVELELILNFPTRRIPRALLTNTEVTAPQVSNHSSDSGMLGTGLQLG